MENQVFSPQNSSGETQQTSGKSKKIILGVVIALFILAAAGAAFFLGKSSQGTAVASPTPSQLGQITQPESFSDTPTPTIKISTISGTITPTKKPSVTPKPSTTPTPAVKTKVLSSSADLDGFRASNNGGNNALEIRAGRNDTLVERGFVSFDLSDIPSGVTITEATLRLYQGQIIGNPYGVGGSIKIDHLTYGNSLDSSDYGMAALSSSFTTLTSNATIEWKDANVTDRVKDDIANARTTSQFRIHFQIENTGGNPTGDFAYFEAAENTLHTGNTPQLVVKYY